MYDSKLRQLHWVGPVDIPSYHTRPTSTNFPRVYAGRSLASSDFNASDLSPKTDRTRSFNASDMSPKTDRTKSCEAILASVMNGPSLIETLPLQERVSGKKTLAALLRENSRRLSDAKLQSINDSLTRQDSDRFSDVKLHFISDSLSGDDSGRFSDATAQSVVDSLSRQDSGRHSDGRKQPSSDALSRQNSSDTRKQPNSVALSRESSRSSARSKATSTEKSVESPRKDYAEKQQDADNVVSKPKTVKQQGSETNKERSVSSAAEGKPKKEKASEEKAKKGKTEEVGEGKSKKERKEETAPTKGKKEENEADWKVEFERRKREIIELWDACHIPLVHRSYFFLLFKGDPSDAVYMEVEQRRLSFLKTGNKEAKDEVPSRYV